MDFQFLDTSNRKNSRKSKWLGRISTFTSRYFQFRLIPSAHPAEMVTLEQAVNFYHFTQHILFADLKGELVEMGSFTGNTALQIQRVLDFYPTGRKLHLFDRFDKQFAAYNSDTITILKSNLNMQD
jgi:hypothetical protein